MPLCPGALSALLFPAGKPAVRLIRLLNTEPLAIAHHSFRIHTDPPDLLCG